MTKSVRRRKQNEVIHFGHEDSLTGSFCRQTLLKAYIGVLEARDRRFWCMRDIFPKNSSRVVPNYWSCGKQKVFSGGWMFFGKVTICK